MKLSTKIILPIILISALLILLNGCMGTVPDDEEPGYTPGTITGIISAPCCSTSAEPVSETSGSPEYWCYYCQNTWNLQDGIEVVLTYGEDEVATTTTNSKGEFTFTDVSPGKNYVVTAYCPDFEDNRPLVKDVALEIIEGGSFDTKTTDLVSTSLGLVVDFLVLYTEWGPEDISLDEVIADKPSFPNFPDFKKLIYEVRRVVENCGNVNTDDDVQEALCLAAEEISKLDIGCAPGFTPTPGPTPTPDPCDGNEEPVITDVTLGGESIFDPDPAQVPEITLVVGETYVFCVVATDTDNILPQDLIYSLTIGDDIFYLVNNCETITPEAGDVGTYEVYVNVDDRCDITTWGPITIVVCPPIDKVVLAAGDDTICVDEIVGLGDLIESVELYDDTVLVETITDPCSDARLSFSVTSGGAYISYNAGTCEVTGLDVGTGEISVTFTPAEGECGSVLEDADSIEVTVVDGIDAVTLVETDFTSICVDEIVGLGDLIESVELYDDTVLVETITDPCSDARLSFSVTSGGAYISYNAGTCEVTGLDVGTGEISVTFTPAEGECGSVLEDADSITIDVDQCLDCFILRVKLGGETNTYTQDYFGGVLYPGEIYVIDEDFSNASKFHFMFNCPPGSLEYNYYRGLKCGGSWESGEKPLTQPLSSAAPPVWLTDPLLKNGVFYPAKLSQGLLLCQKGGNILKIRVNGDNSLVFTFELGRNLPE